jgi:hypothetical protein
VQRIQAFIKSRQKMLERILVDISEHEASLSKTTSAIRDLETAILNRKPAIKAHEANLKTLE